MHRFKRLALQLDCAFETIAWDILIGNMPTGVDENGEFVWEGQEDESAHGYEIDDAFGDAFGFEPSGDY